MKELLRVNHGLYMNREVAGWSQSKPADFRRTCRHPSRPDVTVRPTFDHHLSAKIIFETMQVLMATNARAPPANASTFALVGVEANTLKAGSNLSDRIAFLCVVVLFVDDTMIQICIGRPCQGVSRVQKQIVRDCTLGRPWIKSGNYDIRSDNRPELCLLDEKHPSIVFAVQVIEELLLDPTLRGLYHCAARGGDGVVDFVAGISRDLCTGIHTSIHDMLTELAWQCKHLDNESEERSIEQLEDLTVKSFMDQCPYQCECEERVFQSVFIWAAVAYPMLMVAIKCFARLVPFAYAQLLRFDKEHQSQKKEQEPQVSERSQNVDVACVVAPNPEAAEVAASSQETFLTPIRDSLMELKLHVQNSEGMFRNELKSVGRRLDELERRINIQLPCRVVDRSDILQQEVVATGVEEEADLQQAVARADVLLDELLQAAKAWQETSRNLRDSVTESAEGCRSTRSRSLPPRPPGAASSPARLAGRSDQHARRRECVQSAQAGEEGSSDREISTRAEDHTLMLSRRYLSAQGP